MSATLVEMILLATSEAVNNVIVHAYPDGDGPGEVEVEAAVMADEVCVVVADRGTGFSRRSRGKGLGLGLSVITALADGLELLARDRGLELRMSFATA